MPAETLTEEEQVVEEPLTEEEPTKEEETTEVDEENVSDEEGEKPEDTETQKETPEDEELEEWSSEEEYLAQYELPGNPKSIDEAMTSHKSMLVEMKRLQTELKNIPPAEKLPATNTAQAQPDEWKFSEKPFAAHVTALSENNVFVDEDAKKSYNDMATFADQAMGPMFSKLNTMMSQLASGVMQNYTMHRNSMWGRFSSRNKPAVSRDVLDPIMDQFRFDSYEKALNHYVVNEKPELISQLTRDAEEAGILKGKRRIKRFSANRRGRGPAPSKSYDFKKYVGDDGRLSSSAFKRLSTKEQLKVTDALIKDHEAGDRHRG